MLRTLNAKVFALTGLLGLALLAPQRALAHCDGMDGPVVKAAQQALATGNVNLVLIWIQGKDEPEVRRTFAKTQAVRKLSPEARELADRYFFETVVRIHRAGEGEPYTGLQPAGRDLGPAIPAADRAVDSGSVDLLTAMIADAAGNGVRERFKVVAARKKYGNNDVAAGREYVKAYVEFVHYVEGLHEAVHNGGHDNAHDSQAAGKPEAH